MGGPAQGQGQDLSWVKSVLVKVGQGQIIRNPWVSRDPWHYLLLDLRARRYAVSGRPGQLRGPAPDPPICSYSWKHMWPDSLFIPMKIINHNHKCCEPQIYVVTLLNLTKTTLNERKQTQKESAERSHSCEGQEQAELICDDRTCRGTGRSVRGPPGRLVISVFWPRGWTHRCVHSVCENVASGHLSVCLWDSNKIFTTTKSYSLNVTCLEWLIWN